MTGYQLVRLANGAFSVHSTADGETFHPVAGPAAEAEALYVRQLKLAERMQTYGGEFVIWDVGLGAAANPIAAVRGTAHQKTPMRIVSFDHTTAALEFALSHADQLDYLSGFESTLRRLITDGSVVIGRVRWELHRGDFPALMCDTARRLAQGEEPAFPAPHAIFHDAFSPQRNPEMWTMSLLRDVHDQLAPACSLATYSRSTITRATLLLAGFFVGKGAALAGKEETTVAANDAALIASPLDKVWLERARRSHSAEPLHTPEYAQKPLTKESLASLEKHPQFGVAPGNPPRGQSK